jgi:hypothetical protein
VAPFPAIRSYFRYPQGNIELSFSPESLSNIIGFFFPAFAALAAIAPLMRATRLLTPAELDHLETNCAALGATWREHFAAAHGVKHAPEVHLIERHVVEQARRHGTLGMFGEEAVEAEHPAWARAAQLCRAIKNPRASLLATKRHSEAKKRAAKSPHTKKSRVSKKQRLAAAAGGGGT